MGKLNEFSIKLASAQVVYYPGQVIAGDLVVDLNAPKKINSIWIKLIGSGYCSWSEQKGSGDNRRTENYHNSETLAKQKTYLFGSSDSETDVLPAGKHVYSFSFTLPEQLPSSFHGSKGWIHYLLKGKIILPKIHNHKVKLPFTVNELIDTNNPMYSGAVGGEKHKEVGCLCCVAGPLDLSASIDRGAYCPGETILISANVANQTTRDMEKMRARLVKYITYHASGGHTKIFRIWVANVDGPDIIPSGESAKWENKPLGIPATPPTITKSRVVTVEYAVQFKVKVPWGNDALVAMKIVMGTIPFIPSYGLSLEYDTPQDQQGPPEANYVDGSNYAPPSTSFFGYPDMPPPSYSAVVGSSGCSIAGGKDKHTYGEMNYNPVYTFAQPYQGTIPPYDPPQYSALSQCPPVIEPSAPPLAHPLDNQ